MLTAVQANEADFISVFADEGGENYQAITEIKLENGEVISIVYSQGGFQYLPHEAQVTEPAIDARSTLSVLTNPQLSQFFVPGLFGFTAAGGPIAEENIKVAEASKGDQFNDQNRKASVDTAIDSSFSSRQTNELKIVQDFVPLHSRNHHTTSHSR